MNSRAADRASYFFAALMAAISTALVLILVLSGARALGPRLGAPPPFEPYGDGPSVLRLTPDSSAERSASEPTSPATPSERGRLPVEDGAPDLAAGPSLASPLDLEQINRQPGKSGRKGGHAPGVLRRPDHAGEQRDAPPGQGRRARPAAAAKPAPGR